MNKKLKKLQKKAGITPRVCPRCGCQCFDPLGGHILLHDVDTCKGVADIVHVNDISKDEGYQG